MHTRILGRGVFPERRCSRACRLPAASCTSVAGRREMPTVHTWTCRVALMAVLAVGLRAGSAQCVPTPGEEDCEMSLHDGIDNDCNGLLDADDPGCFGPPDQWMRPGDCNSDGRLDVSDPICLLGHLFFGKPASLPCADGGLEDSANISLLDANGDEKIDLSDAIHDLKFLFIGDPPSVRGTFCIVVASCPRICDASPP